MYLCPRALSAFGTALQEIQCSPLQLQKPKDLHLSRTVCRVFFWNTDIGDICGPSNFHFWGLYLGCISSHAVLIPKVLTFVIMFPSTTGPSTISPISVLCSPHFTFSAALWNEISGHRTNPEVSQLLISVQVSPIHKTLSFMSFCLKDPTLDQGPALKCWYCYSCLIIILSAYSIAIEDNSLFFRIPVLELA